MQTEQPDSSGSEMSIEDRLASLEAPQTPEADESPAAAAPAEVEAADQTDEQAEAEDVQPGDDFVDVEYEGVTFKAPAKAKDAFMRDADYTRSKQETARIAEAAQDRIHFAEAREQVIGQIMQDVAEAHALESQVKAFDNVDWQAAYANDPGHAMRMRDQRDALKQQLQERRQLIQAKAANAQQMATQHSEKQWALAVEGAKARIGSFTPAEDAAMARVAQELGFTDKELKSRFADPRVLHAIYKAAKWDALQKSKPGAVAAVSKAPPVLKPGASQGQRAATESKYKETRQALKKSGSVDDAARLFMLRG